MTAASLVSTEWLAERRDDPAIVAIDASWHMPAEGRDARAEYAGAHLPGARFFDIEGLSDRGSAYPHMLPDPEAFAEAMGRLGIGDATMVVAYDTVGLFSAARAWWMLRVFGHERVAVLDGGLPKWRREGRPLSSENVTVAPAAFTPRYRPELVAGRDAIEARLPDASQLLDARSRERFEGGAPEPRAGLASGHVPGSRNLPWPQLLNAEQTFRPLAEIETLFDATGIDRQAPIITTCGSGISACTLALGLHLLGNTDVAVYDGSWSEWGSLGLPVETGARAS